MAGCVLPHDHLGKATSRGLPEISEFPIIGAESPDEGLDAGRMSWPHGFHLRHITISPGSTTRPHSRAEEEVILMHCGRLRVSMDDGDVELGPGDVFTVPVGYRRILANPGEDRVEAYVVRGGDHPQAARLVDSSDS